MTHEMVTPSNIQFKHIYNKIFAKAFIFLVSKFNIDVNKEPLGINVG